MSNQFNPKNECYTPSYFIDPIRKFANGFDYDPYSSALANETIKANEYGTLENGIENSDSGYNWQYYNTLWVNPPYSTKELKQAIGKVIGYREGREIYLLLNTDNSTTAYKLCLRYCTAIMLASNRIRFIRPYSDSVKNQNNRAQTLFFFGTIERAEQFKASLSHLGKVFIND